MSGFANSDWLPKGRPSSSIADQGYRVEGLMYEDCSWCIDGRGSQLMHWRTESSVEALTDENLRWCIDGRGFLSKRKSVGLGTHTNKYIVNQLSSLEAWNLSARLILEYLFLFCFCVVFYGNFVVIKRSSFVSMLVRTSGRPGRGCGVNLKLLYFVSELDMVLVDYFCT